MSSLSKSIETALKFVDRSKTYNTPCRIIDSLLKEFQKFIKKVEIEQSDIELNNFEKEFYKSEIKRLKKIIKLHGGNDNLDLSEISFLEGLKDESQYYSGDSTNWILFKARFIDVVLLNKMPNKQTRPNSIEHINQSYEILTEKYGNSKH